VIVKIVLSILSAGIGLCLIDGFFIEPYQLVVEKLEIRTSKLTTNRIRIVQLSDLHCDDVIRLENRIKASVTELHPDVIVFCGDAVNMPEGLNNFRSVMKSCADVAPTYAVRGDWDFFKPRLDYFGGTGAQELSASSVKIEKNGESIWLGGVLSGSPKLVPRALAEIPPGAFTVFAYHFPYPDVLPANASVDLFLAGHTHGGQVVLPGVGVLITRSKYGTRYLSGMYRVGKMWMYVNSGIGMQGRMPRVRFLCPPKLAVIDIVPEGGK
jgi:hypothetical protein